MRQRIWKVAFVKHGAIVVATVAGMLSMAGCNIPFVSPDDGAIGSGDPKLRALLHIVREIRDRDALRSRNVVDAVYVASAESGVVPVCWEGRFPPTDRAVTGRYHLVLSQETGRDASVAVVTQFLVTRRDGDCEVQTYSKQFVWHDGRWEEVSMIRTGLAPKPDDPVTPGRSSGKEFRGHRTSRSSGRSSGDTVPNSE